MKSRCGVFARNALEKQGYRVLEAGHGREALMRLAEFDGPVHLVIADVVMPEMGGSELARRLAVERPGVPILFLSGYTDDEITQRGLGPPQRVSAEAVHVGRAGEEGAGGAG